jgi:hypothetical protein
MMRAYHIAGDTASQEYTMAQLAECLDKLNETLVGKEGYE